MKSLLILIALFTFSTSCYSQSDTVALNTPAIFSITFKEYKKSFIFDRNHTTYKEVYLDVLTKEYLIIRKKYDDENDPNAISRYLRISLDDVEGLGYATGTQETFGGLIGMSIGAVGGTVLSLIAKGFDKGEGKFNPGRIESISTPVLVWAGAGAILGYIIGGHSNEYKTFELSTFNNEKKYQEINKIVKKGLTYSGKK